MKTKQELLIDVLASELSTCKVGLLVKGISGISPLEVMRTLSSRHANRLYAAAVGYDCLLADETGFLLTDRIEDAVGWRSDPELAGCIVAFVRSESNKLHSLKELDVITERDVSKRLVTDRAKEDNQNTPTREFWKAIEKILTTSRLKPCWSSLRVSMLKKTRAARSRKTCGGWACFATRPSWERKTPVTSFQQTVTL